SAACSGSPYEVSVPAAPCTRRTAAPLATSTAGRITKVIEYPGPRGAMAALGSQRAQPVRQQRGTAVAGFLGMKLRRADDAVLDRGDEFLAMACGGHGPAA